MSKTKIAIFLILVCCQQAVATASDSMATKSDEACETRKNFATLKEQDRDKCITKSIEILCADARKHRDNIWTLDIESNKALRNRVEQYYDELSNYSSGPGETKNSSSQDEARCTSAESIWLRVSLAHFASERAMVQVDELQQKANSAEQTNTGYFIFPKKSKFLENIEAASEPLKNLQRPFNCTTQPKSRRIDPKNTGDFYDL